MEAEKARRAAQELQLQVQLSYFHGRTMLPFLQEGDLVRVVPVEWEQIRLGDVLTVRFQDRYPTRRVVHIDHPNRRLILKGDSIPGRPAFHVLRQDVLGRAVARQRHGTWLDESQWGWKFAAARALAAEWFFQLRMLAWELRRPR